MHDRGKDQFSDRRWPERRSELDAPGECAPGPDTEVVKADEANAVEVPPRMPLIRMAKIVCRHAEYPCVMRDVSGASTRVKLYYPLPQGEKVFVLEFGTGERFEVEPIWEKDGHAGLALLDPSERFSLCAAPGPYEKRAIRLAVDIPTRLRILGLETEVKIRDISHEGARIVTDHLMSVEQQIRLVVPGLSEVYARVRWRRHPEYGLAFIETFQFEELARIVGELQERAERAKSSADAPPDRRARATG